LERIAGERFTNVFDECLWRMLRECASHEGNFVARANCFARVFNEGNFVARANCFARVFNEGNFVARVFDRY
jgi:hypothetical protein